MPPKKWFRKTPVVQPEDMEQPIDIEGEGKDKSSSPDTFSTDKQSDISEESPIVSYRETLYSRDPQKKSTSQARNTSKRRSWESPVTVEKNVDVMRQKPLREVMQTPNRDVEVKVDKVLAKKKNR